MLAIQRQKELVNIFAQFLHNCRVVVHQPIHYPPFYLDIQKGVVKPVPSSFVSNAEFTLHIMPDGITWKIEL